MDVIGADVRLGGENFAGTFPAIQLNDSGTLDTLIIRRNLLSEVLPLCTALVGGTNTNAYFAIPGTVAGCTFSGQTSNYNAWRAYRLANGGTVDAFIWDSSAKLGEFFQYDAEVNGGTNYQIHRVGTWSRNYPTASTAVYVMEEFRFQPGAGNTLQLVTNQNFASPGTVAFNVIAFNINVTLNTGAVQTSFPATSDWTTIRLISASITARERLGGTDYTRTLAGNYFPRNVLSK